MTTPLNHTKRKKWIVVTLFVIAIVICSAIGITRQARLYLAQEATEKKLALAQRDAAVLAVAKVQADIEKAETERQLAVVEVEKSRAERKLLLAERQMVADREREIRALVDKTKDAAAEISKAGVIVSWSPGAEKKFGWKHEEIVGKHASFLVGKEIVERHLAGFDKPMAFIQTVAKHKDGRDVVVLITDVPFIANDVQHGWWVFIPSDEFVYIDARPGHN